MPGYLLNKLTEELHNKHRDERCNVDDMLEEHKLWLPWKEAQLLIVRQKVGFCGWCWGDDE